MMETLAITLIAGTAIMLAMLPIKTQSDVVTSRA